MFTILQKFFATPAVLKIEEYHSDISQLQLRNFQAHDVFRPAREQKYLIVYNGSQPMMSKPIKTLELHYTMIQFYINMYYWPAGRYSEKL